MEIAERLTTFTPVQIDTEIARIEAEIAAQRDILDTNRRLLSRAEQSPLYYEPVQLRRAHLAIALATLALERRKAEIAPFDAEYDRRGRWNRFYLVDAYNGHVHRDLSTRHCSRTNTTAHVWLVSESGKTHVEVVELAGDRACTVCFPWAPVETLKRPSAFVPPSAAEKETRKVERAQRAAVKAAKAITNPDGTPLRVTVDGYPETVKTVRAAEMKVVEIAYWADYHGRPVSDREQAGIQVILQALAAKKGTTVEVEWEAAALRLAAKLRREARQA